MASRCDWETVRAEYEAGASQSALAQKYGVSRTAIQKHIRQEGWTQDVTDAINRLTEAKVAGVVAGCNHKKKAEAMAAAADEKAAIIFEHRAAWAGVNKELIEARKARDFDTLKCLKISIEATKLAQEGERKAWGIVDAVTETKAQQDVNVTLDFSGRSRDELRDLVRVAYGREKAEQQ